MVILELITPMVEQVRPVVRPLLATDIPSCGTASVAEGGASAMPVGSALPGARPLLAWVGMMVDWNCRLATVLDVATHAGEAPGWSMASPLTPKLPLARTRLVLRI